MIKSFLTGFLALTALALNASGIKFLDNPEWSIVLAQAKKENKMIFFDAYATWCGPCKKMDAETYTDAAVADFYNANFINVKYDMEKGEGAMLADRYYVSAYPNLIFISPEGIMLHKSVGFIAANKFLELGKIARDPATQYYTLKKKALQLSPQQFLQFSTKAIELQDEDFDYLSKDFLSAQPDILGTPELVDLVMQQIISLPKEKDLAYFVANKEKVLSGGKYTDADYQERLINLALHYGLSAEVQVTDEVNFEAIKAVLDKYVPEQAFFAYHYFKSQYFLENKEKAEALQAFNTILEHPSKSSFSQVCNAVLNMGPTLYEEGKLEEVFTKFDAIPVPPEEAEQAYLKSFVKAIIYIRTKQIDKFKDTAEIIIANPSAPDEVKKDLQLALKNIKK